MRGSLSARNGKICEISGHLARKRYRLIELSLDPKNDRPPILRRYAAASGASGSDLSFANGRNNDVIALSERFGIVRSLNRNGTIEHSDAVAIVSSVGTLQTLVSGSTWSPADLAEAARNDVGERANPVRRFALALFATASAACGASAAAGFSLFGTLTVFASAVVASTWFAVRLFASAFERS